MSAIRDEARNFRLRKQRELEEARQTAAFFLMCGIDLAAALETSGDVREGIVRRVRRLIERERLKGARRHWSYDLNRHIALKQALDLLCPTDAEKPVRKEASRTRKRKRRP